MAKKLELTARTLELISRGIPDPGVGPTENRFAALLKDLLTQVNELNGFTTTTVAPTTTVAVVTTTVAPTTTVAGSTTTTVAGATTTTVAGSTTTTAHP